MKDVAPLIVASNRGPVTLERVGGRTEEHRPAGGLVPILVEALRERGATWVCAAMTEADRRAKNRTVDGTAIRFVNLAPEVFDGAYNGISNGVLWFLHHTLWDLSTQPVFGDEMAAAWRFYVGANSAFAKAMTTAAGTSAGVRIGRGRATYLIQDYHLALAPAMVRAASPGARIAHFSHTPFADPAYLRVLPEAMAEELLRGMLGADVLGFHAAAWADNFRSAALGLEGVRAAGPHGLRVDGREIRVRAYAVTPPASLEAEASTDPVRAARAKLERRLGDCALLLRVDRFELSKNILRGFLAFEAFINDNPEWKGKVVHLALLSPTRETVPAYREYAKVCIAEAKRINRELGAGDWTPIDVRVRDDHAEVLAAYGIYDALLVDPITDGLNLVAMEGPMLNEHDGPLILSRTAGAFETLGRHTLGVNPYDVREQAAAIKAALEMDPQERRTRAVALARVARANPPATWMDDQIADLPR